MIARKDVKGRMDYVSYVVRDNAVLIYRDVAEDVIPLTEANVRLAIDNITKEHDFYATEEAWQKQLGIYKGALAYLLLHRHAMYKPD